MIKLRDLLTENSYFDGGKSIFYIFSNRLERFIRGFNNINECKKYLHSLEKQPGKYSTPWKGYLATSIMTGDSFGPINKNPANKKD